MNWLRPILRECHWLMTCWALKEIPPLHEDVPMLVLRRHRLEAEREAR
jgi:hypothetical protein